MSPRLPQWILRIQSAYYVATGALPLVSMAAFEWMTGPKTDLWLVRMVALLAVAIGIALAVGSRRARPAPETVVLALASAFAFFAIDVTYVLAGVIARIYLADAVVEAAIGAALAVALVRRGPVR